SGDICINIIVSSFNDVVILTNDSIKVHLLDSKIADMFNVDGLYVSDRIISFDDLGGIWKETEDITISEEDTLNKFRAMGDYQISMGDIVPEDYVIIFDVTKLTEFEGKVEEVKLDSDLFAYVFDINKLRYRRTTKELLKLPFYNGEFDEITYWLHYYSFKSMSPFYNSILVSG